MKSYFQLLALMLSGSMLQAASIKNYGSVAQANLSDLPTATAELNFSICDTQNPNRCNLNEITWSRISDANQDGLVDFVSDGTMSRGGWMVADAFIKFDNVQVNTPGWGLFIYTDNLKEPLYKGSGINQKGAVSGLVSESGEFRIPLAWKWVAQPITSFTSQPMPEEAESNKECPNGVKRLGDGFCDFAFHYLVDLNDRNPNSTPKGQSVWWQKLDDATEKEKARNYQAVLAAEGAAAGDFYRLPYPTIGKNYGQLYLAAKFDDNVFPNAYQTKIYIEFLSL